MRGGEILPISLWAHFCDVLPVGFCLLPADPSVRWPPEEWQSSGELVAKSFLGQIRVLMTISILFPVLASANSRKDKSLRIMSQKFVMLFLVSKTKIVTLDVAAKILIEESQDTPDHSKFKSKNFHLIHVSAQKGRLLTLLPASEINISRGGFY